MGVKVQINGKVPTAWVHGILFVKEATWQLRPNVILQGVKIQSIRELIAKPRVHHRAKATNVTKLLETV
jgi:hypothetical protein